MDSNKIPILAALGDRMRWLTGNQRMLAQNVANADTPGYRSQALAPQDFRALVEASPAQAGSTAAPVALARTHQGHLTKSGTAPGDTTRASDAEVTQSAPDGNAVDLEDEMLKVAQNQMDYGLMVELYRKQTGMLRTALRGPGGGDR